MVDILEGYQTKCSHIARPNMFYYQNKCFHENYSVKCSDVTGIPFEWLLGENNVI